METEFKHNPMRLLEVLLLMLVIVLIALFEIVSIPIKAVVKILTLLDAEAMTPALKLYNKWEQDLSVAGEEA